MPIPWSGDAPPYGFGPGRRPALAAAAARLGGPHGRGPGAGPGLDAGVLPVGAGRPADARRGPPPRRSSCSTPGADVLAFRRGALTVVLNAGADAVELPAGEVVLASGELEGRLLPADTAVWLA